MTNYNRQDSSSVAHMLRCINHIMYSCHFQAVRSRDMDYRRTLVLSFSVNLCPLLFHFSIFRVMTFAVWTFHFFPPKGLLLESTKLDVRTKTFDHQSNNGLNETIRTTYFSFNETKFSWLRIRSTK